MTGAKVAKLITEPPMAEDRKGQKARDSRGVDALRKSAAGKDGDGKASADGPSLGKASADGPSLGNAARRAKALRLLHATSDLPHDEQVSPAPWWLQNLKSQAKAKHDNEAATDGEDSGHDEDEWYVRKV